MLENSTPSLSDFLIFSMKVRSLLAKVILSSLVLEITGNMEINFNFRFTFYFESILGSNFQIEI